MPLSVSLFRILRVCRRRMRRVPTRIYILVLYYYTLYHATVVASYDCGRGMVAVVAVVVSWQWGWQRCIERAGGRKVLALNLSPPGGRDGYGGGGGARVLCWYRRPMPPPPGRRTLSHLQPPVQVHRSGSVIPSRVQVSSRSRLRRHHRRFRLHRRRVL